MAGETGPTNQNPTILGVASPFFSTIVLSENQPFPQVAEGFLERFGSLGSEWKREVPLEPSATFRPSTCDVFAAGPPASFCLVQGLLPGRLQCLQCRASDRRESFVQRVFLHLGGGVGWFQKGAQRKSEAIFWGLLEGQSHFSLGLSWQTSKCLLTGLIISVRAQVASQLKSDRCVSLHPPRNSINFGCGWGHQ